MKVLLGLMTLVAAVAAVDNYFHLPPPYCYACIEGQCIRIVRQGLNSPVEELIDEQLQNCKYGTTPQECNLICGRYGSLWPRPSKEVTLSTETIPFLPQNTRFTKVSANPEVEEMLQEQAHYFMRNLHFQHSDYQQKSKGPFTDYQQEKYNPESNFGYTQLDYGHYLFTGDETERVARFDLFDLHNKQRKEQPEKQSQDQSQDFQFNFRSDVRRRRELMRYERISPFTKQTASPIAYRQILEIEVTVNGPETRLSIDTDESYELSLLTTGDITTATITADTYYGARHAMESLSQMISYDEIINSLRVVKTAKITDEPAFKYRGIMLDTGRNFYPKEEIMSLMDSMATNKLNTFHWHVSDAASFPMYSKRQPELTRYGAYSASKVYYPQDVREIVEYANQRGIRVIPELAAPAHAGAGWNLGEIEGMGKLVLCNKHDDVWFQNCKEPICGQLNPTNPQVYEVLKDVYSDILEAFNPEFVHMGGDDTSFKCWKNSQEITNFLTSQNREVGSNEVLFELWNTFQSTAFNKLSESVKETGTSRQVTPMIYSSKFVRNYIDPKQYIVQIMDDVDTNSIQEYISKGYKIVFNAETWIFEGPAPSWPTAATNKNEITRPDWRQVYQSSPLDMLIRLGAENVHSDAEHGALPRDQILGGEAMVFSYETDAQSLQSTVWPRGAALAERLWTDPAHGQYQAEEVSSRLSAHRERMVNRGTRAQTFQPEYCFQNQNSCYTEEEYKNRHNKPQN